MASKSIDQVIKETRIEQLKKSQLVQTKPDISIKEAVELMQKNRSGFLVLAEGLQLKGMFTEVDLAHKILDIEVDWKQPVSRFMNATPIVLSPKDNVGKAIDVMGQNRLFHVPLVNEKQELVGVLSVRALIRFLAEFYPTEVFNLPPKPDQLMETVEGG